VSGAGGVAGVPGGDEDAAVTGWCGAGCVRTPTQRLAAMSSAIIQVVVNPKSALHLLQQSKTSPQLGIPGSF
jgi:hypothetical protein